MTQHAVARGSGDMSPYIENSHQMIIFGSNSN